MIQQTLFEGDLTETQINIFYLLQRYPALRESDKALIWAYWNNFDNAITETGDDFMVAEHITYDNFMDATHPETIRRNAAFIRSRYPELRGTEKIQKAREKKEEEMRGEFK